MLEQALTVLKNSLIITVFFFILFSALEFYRTRDVIDVFQRVFKAKYLQVYIVTFFTALLLQIVIFPLIKLIF